MNPETNQLTELHRECADTLARYILELQKSCDALSDVSRFPVSLDQRQVLLNQRKAESAALSHYHDARGRLYDAASWS